MIVLFFSLTHVTWYFHVTWYLCFSLKRAYACNLILLFFSQMYVAKECDLDLLFFFLLLCVILTIKLWVKETKKINSNNRWLKFGSQRSFECLEIHAASGCLDVKVWPISTVRNGVSHFYAWLVLNTKYHVNTLHHESSFSKSNKRIKPQQIFFGSVFKPKYIWNICFLIVRKFVPKIPMQIFAYLITKAMCIYPDLLELCNESVLKHGSINVSCFAFSNKTNYNMYIFDESNEIVVLV